MSIRHAGAASLLLLTVACDDAKQGASASSSAAPKPARSAAPGSSVAAAKSTATAAASASGAAEPTGVSCTSLTPTCQDPITALVCKVDGSAETIDCARRGRRCVRGVCALPLCEPNQEHCFEGSVFRCNAHGAARALVTDCGDDQICIGDGRAHCASSCTKPHGSVLAMYSCECDWTAADFCADMAEGSCAKTLCAQGGELGGGVGPGVCYRDTNGLTVPGSKRRTSCVMLHGVSYAPLSEEVCVDGKPLRRERLALCSASGVNADTAREP